MYAYALVILQGLFVCRITSTLLPFQREGEKMKQETQQDKMIVTNFDEPQVSADTSELTKRKPKIKFFTAGNIAVIAILTAISFILYAFVKFPLPFMFPSFLDMQISDLPALLGGFALGPVAGCIIIVVKCCIKMAMTTTACIGELADIIIGIANVLPASLVYRFIKNRKGAAIGLAAGTLCAIAASLLANWLILIPFYTERFGMNAVLGMMKALYPEITADTLYNYYLPLAVLPFNALRCIVCGLITFFTYKPLSKALHWEIHVKKKKPADGTNAEGADVQPTEQDDSNAENM